MSDWFNIMNNWFSVALDGYPDIAGVYLTYDKDGSFRILPFSPNLQSIDEYDFAGRTGPGFYDLDHEYGYWEVTCITHWMRLPKPPEEVSGNA